MHREFIAKIDAVAARDLPGADPLKDAADEARAANVKQPKAQRAKEVEEML